MSKDVTALIRQHFKLSLRSLSRHLFIAQLPSKKLFTVLSHRKKTKLDLASRERDALDDNTSHRSILVTERANVRSEILNSVHQPTQKSTTVKPSNVACCKLEALSALQCIVLLHKTCAPDALQNSPSRKNSNN
jgi:hypothetical protein